MMKRVVLGLLVLAIVLVVVAGTHTDSADLPTPVDASTFFRELDEGSVYTVHVSGDTVYYRRAGSTSRFSTRAPVDSELAKRISDRAIGVTDPWSPAKVHRSIRLTYARADETPWWQSLLSTWLPFVVLVGIWWYFLAKMQGKKWTVVQKPAHELPKLDAAGGYQPIKNELKDLLRVVKGGDGLNHLGGRPPRSAMLVGPSGTGKTLMARCAAGDAGLPLLEVAGSEFVYGFAGVSSDRVKSLFEQAKASAPCVVLIDQIDVIGQRSAAAAQEPTGRDPGEALNQMLTELDKVTGDSKIFILATTTRPEVLDPSLVRPGRFDLQLRLGLPDQKDREAILKASAVRIPVDSSLDWAEIAQYTDGTTAAHLDRLVNEAAVVAGRNQRSQVTRQDFLDGLQRLKISVTADV